MNGLTLNPDKRSHIAFPVHCNNCKKPMCVEWRLGAKVAICENDKCLKNRSYKRIVLDDRTVEISNWIMFV